MQNKKFTRVISVLLCVLLVVVLALPVAADDIVDIDDTNARYAALYAVLIERGMSSPAQNLLHDYAWSQYWGMDYLLSGSVVGADSVFIRDGSLSDGASLQFSIYGFAGCYFSSVTDDGASVHFEWVGVSELSVTLQSQGVILSLYSDEEGHEGETIFESTYLLENSDGSVVSSLHKMRFYSDSLESWYYLNPAYDTIEFAFAFYDVSGGMVSNLATMLYGENKSISLTNFRDGYDVSTDFKTGYQAALSDVESGEFGENFLGNMFSAPIKAVQGITLVHLPDGASITLGHVMSALIALLLVLAFVKIYSR